MSYLTQHVAGQHPPSRRKIPDAAMATTRVTATGAVFMAPRELELVGTDEQLVVRDLQGVVLHRRLTGDAFEQGHGSALDPHEAGLLPLDHGAEAVAMYSIELLADWLHVPMGFDETSELHYLLLTEAGFQVEATVDEATGIVRRVRGDNPAGTFTIDATTPVITSVDRVLFPR